LVKEPKQASKTQKKLVKKSDETSTGVFSNKIHLFYLTIILMIIETKIRAKIGSEIEPKIVG